jgi:hypothetical protein
MITNRLVMGAVTTNHVGLTNNNQSYGPTCTCALEDDARAYLTMLNVAECPQIEELPATQPTWSPLRLPFAFTKARSQCSRQATHPRRFWRKHSWG